MAKSPETSRDLGIYYRSDVITYYAAADITVIRVHPASRTLDKRNDQWLAGAFPSIPGQNATRLKVTSLGRLTCTRDFANKR